MRNHSLRSTIFGVSLLLAVGSTLIACTGDDQVPQDASSESGPDSGPDGGPMISPPPMTLQLSAPLVSSVAWGAPDQGQVQALGLNDYIAVGGVFPSSGGGNGTATPYLGQVISFAGRVVPAGWHACDGALLSINQNQALFSLLGTKYGGNGTTTFALPDLRSRVKMGAGVLQGGTIPNSVEGISIVPSISTIDQGSLALGQPEAYGMNYYIAAQGIFPSQGAGTVSTTGPYLGQILSFSGNFAPGGWLPCDGRLLAISQNAALFSLIGTTYGGNGTTNFALPDLRGRVPMGVGAVSAPPVVAATSNQIPIVSSLGLGQTGRGQIGVLGMNYLIADSGVFPSSGAGGPTSNYVGQLLLFAGGFAPSGWFPCDGRLLNIADHAPLFSLIGITYGGNGTTTFALPDLRGRVPMTPSSY